MKKSFIVSMIISIISFVIAIGFIISNEGQIPVNWNSAGEVDRYGSSLVLFIFPAAALLTTLLIYCLPKIDPKGDNIKKSGPILQILMIIIASLMLGIQIFMIMAINGANILNMNKFILLALGIMFIVIGYNMPRIKPNYMLGIRTPWTLYSEKVWKKTHEDSKKWFMGLGVILIISMFLPTPYNLVLSLICVMVVTIGTIVYSYIVFAREKKTSKKTKSKK